MYDNEDEISGKRRRLIIIIAIVIAAIVAIILFLVFRAIGGSKKSGELTCELEVLNGATPDANGIYNDEIEVGYKRVGLVSDDYQLIKQTVGMSDNSKNTGSFKITKSGKYKVHGYLQDSNGNEGTCELEVAVQVSKPTCELEVKTGQLGTNGWYNTNVEVGFKDKSSNSAAEIVKYFIDKAGAGDISSRDVNNDTFTVADEGETELVAYIVDSEGKSGTCNLTIKKDSTPPTCTLKVLTGTLSDGVYTDPPTIGFEGATDNLTDVTEKGVGTTKNYASTSYTLNENGTFSIYGYVKDGAGNEGTCSISVTKGTASGGDNPGGGGGNPGGGGGGGTVVDNPPSCYLYIHAIAVDAGSNKFALYDDGNGKVVKVTMSTSANTTAYGIGTSETFNGQKEYRITSPGTYQITGFVKNSSGVTAYCRTPQFTVVY